MTEEALRGVVAVYDWCVATGRKPLGVLERDYGMPRGKASRWLARARGGAPPLRRTSGAEHGTLSAYNRCRKRPEGSCEECKAAKREYIDGWKDKRDPDRPKRASRHLTPLPGGGYAEQEWKRLSAHQRKVLEGVARGQPSLLDEVPQYILTIRALIRRGFVDDRTTRELTPRGAALFVWAQGRSSTGAS